MLIGAGGAGSAVAVAVADAGAKTMTIFDVDAGKAKALADRVAAAFPDCAVRAGPVQIFGHDTLINATPIGMVGHPGMPLSPDLLRQALSAGREATDEASLCEELGIPVAVVPVSRLGFKITSPEDLEMAEAILRRREK